MKLEKRNPTAGAGNQSDGDNVITKKTAVKAIFDGLQATTSDLNESIVETYKTPEEDKYQLRNDGVYYLSEIRKTGRDGIEQVKEITIKICDPLRIIAQTETTDHEYFGKVLEWRDGNGRAHRKIIKNSQIQNNIGEIRGLLADCGLGSMLLKGNRAKDHLQAYLHSANPKKKIYLAQKLGWYKSPDNDKYSFVLPDRTVGEDAGNVIFDNNNINMQWISTVGTLTEWKNKIAKPALSSNRCVFAISTVFASSLLDILDGYVDSRIFEFEGESSTGKTFALLFAQSVLGYRDKLSNWRTTQNGLERMALAHNDCTIFLDEIGIIDKPQQILGDIYLLCNGSSKTRSNTTLTTNKTENWKLLGLATGEVSLKQFGNENKLKIKAGQEIRMANIPANAKRGYGIFENVPQGFKSMDDLSKEISDAFSCQYGTAYKEWIDRLVDLRNFSQGSCLKERIIEQIDEFVREAFKGKEYSDQILRVAKTFGLVAVAGNIASGAGLLDRGEESKFNITGWKCNEAESRGDAWRASLVCFRAWLFDFGASKLSKEAQEIIDNARYIFETQQSRFLEETDEKPPKDQIGWWTYKNGKKVFYVQSESYKENFCRGRKPSLVNDVLMECGMLIQKEGTCHPKTHCGTSTCVKVLVEVDFDEFGDVVSSNTVGDN